MGSSSSKQGVILSISNLVDVQDDREITELVVRFVMVVYYSSKLPRKTIQISGFLKHTNYQVFLNYICIKNHSLPNISTNK